MSATAETKTPDIFDADQYPREKIAENVNAWNTVHRELKLAKLKLEIETYGLKKRKKELEKAFDTLYGTHPEDWAGSDNTPLLDGIEPVGAPGTLKTEVDLGSGTMAAAQLFPAVKSRLTKTEFTEWMRSFLDTGDEILGEE